MCRCLPKKKTLDLLGMKPDGCEPPKGCSELYWSPLRLESSPKAIVTLNSNLIVTLFNPTNSLYCFISTWQSQMALKFLENRSSLVLGDIKSWRMTTTEGKWHWLGHSHCLCAPSCQSSALRITLF